MISAAPFSSRSSCSFTGRKFAIALISIRKRTGGYQEMQGSDSRSV
jgi:hypothetical protein